MARTLLARREGATDHLPALFGYGPLHCVSCIARVRSRLLSLWIP